MGRPRRPAAAQHLGEHSRKANTVSSRFSGRAERPAPCPRTRFRLHERDARWTGRDAPSGGQDAPPYPRAIETHDSFCHQYTTNQAPGVLIPEGWPIIAVGRRPYAGLNPVCGRRPTERGPKHPHPGGMPERQRFFHAHAYPPALLIPHLFTRESSTTASITVPLRSTWCSPVMFGGSRFARLALVKRKVRTILDDVPRLLQPALDRQQMFGVDVVVWAV